MRLASAPEAPSSYSLEHLSNEALLASLRGQVGRSNQILATLLAHLAEVEARGLHRVRACSSLVTYCIYELRLSEDAALRRVHAARAARRFPVIFEHVAAGEIHLTALLMLAPHLTDENHREVLARAKYRTKREVAALVRLLDPLPDVPARVEPLGPARAEAGRRSPLVAPTAGEFARALAGPVRELPKGDRPKDWRETAFESSTGSAEAPRARQETKLDLAQEPARETSLAPQRYKVQFTATQEYVEVLEQARDLLAHAVPDRDLAEVHLRALRVLVAGLRKRKYALTKASVAQSRAASDPAEGEPRVETDDPAPERDVAANSSARAFDYRAGADAPDSRADAVEHRAGAESPPSPRSNPRRRGGSERCQRDASEARSHSSGESRQHDDREPRRRGRYLPAAERRAVVERDGERCAYVDAEGRRCRETGGLEFHHVEPHARGGPATMRNLSLRCRAHNALAADEDFGSAFMARAKTRRR